MKKILLILFVFICTSIPCFSSEPDYRQIYMNLEVPSFSYVHGLDPGQYYDNQHASYSVYPLFRLSAPLYFKTVTIVPGYYDLTPREHNEKPYMLFKQNGAVRYIIPVYKKELVPAGFYETHLSKPKRTVRQKFFDFVGKHFKSAKRQPQVKTYLEVNDLDNNFVSIIFYYKDYRYYSILRKVQM